MRQSEMRKGLWGRAGFGITALAMGLAPRAAAQSSSSLLLSITDMDQSGPSRAYAINNVGQVVGWASTESARHSAHWLNEEFTDLHGTSHLALDLIFTANYSEAYDISNAGQIVGTARTKIRCEDEEWIISCGFILAPAVQSDLGTPYPGDALANLWTFGNPCYAHNSAATAISDANHVVGWADVDGAGAIRAFMLRPVNGRWFVDGNSDLVNDLMINLGTLDAISPVSAAHGVNDAGWVTGYSYISESNTSNGEAAYHAFLVMPQGGSWYVDANADGVNDLMIDLGTLGGNNSWGRAINGGGVVVGESTTTDRNTHAFKWQGGIMTDLGTLGGANSSASGINDAGDIVGWAEDSNGVRKAVMWKSGQITDLNNVLLATQLRSITLSEARGINEDNEIAGFGKSASGEINQGYLLKPASTSQRAAHETYLAQQAGTQTGTTPSGTSTNADHVGGSTSLTPVTGQSSGDTGGSAAPDTSGASTGGGAAPQPFGLCAVGAGFSSMLTLMGLLGMRRACRRS